MIEIVNAVLNSIKGGVEINKHSSDKKKAKVGVNFYAVYASLNQLLFTGYSIIGSLETYIAEDENIDEKHKYKKSFCLDYILERLKEQNTNINIFLTSIENLFLELSIVDGNFARDMPFLVMTEGGVMENLQLILERGVTPFPGIKAMQFSELTIAQIAKFVELMITHGVLYDIEKYEKYLKQHYEYDKINEHLRAEIKCYFDSTNPKKILDEIKEVLDLYKETLEKNFTISDILVEVGKNPYGKNNKMDLDDIYFYLRRKRYN